MQESGAFDLLVWLLVVELLSFAALPILLSIFNAPRRSTLGTSHLLHDAGYGASKVLGILLFGLITWLPAALGVVSINRAWVTFCFALLIGSGLLIWSSFSAQEKSASILTLKRHLVPVEGVFIGLSLAFAYIRYLNPEIFWGEKPMDATFLNFFTRNQELPPIDPWASGNSMSYYYLGIYFIAALLKLTGIPVAIGYNLAIASLAGLIGVALYSLFSLLTRNRSFSMVGALLIVLASNPEVLRISLFEKRAPSFDTFWASTRVLTSPFFYEYTSWSLLFADLHAHVIAIPFTVLAIFLTAVCYLGAEVRFQYSGVVSSILLGALLGALYAINTWDVISFGGVCMVLIFLTPVAPFWSPPSRTTRAATIAERLFASGFARMVAWIWDFLIVGLVAVCIAAPYSAGSGAKAEIRFGWANWGEFNELSQVLLMIGYWVALMLFALSILLAYSKPSRRWFFGGGSFLTVAALVVLPAVVNQSIRGMNPPWGLVGVFALFAGIYACWFAGSCTSDRADRCIAILGLSGCALVAILEQFFLIDRMNTLFKGYMAVWMLLSVTSCYVVWRAWKVIRREGDLLTGAVMLTPVAIIAALSISGTALNIKAIASTQRVPQRVFTLDGDAFLTAQSPGDAYVIAWLNHFVSGTPTILEAHGESYREYTRIAMHTGLPTVIGWEHHVRQRGLSEDELRERKDAVRTIYTSNDPLLTKMLLLKYRIELIVVGEIEKEKYGASNLVKFEANSEEFKKIASGGGTSVYATKFSPYFEMKDNTES